MREAKQSSCNVRVRAVSGTNGDMLSLDSYDAVSEDAAFP